MQIKEHLIHFMLSGEIHLSRNDYNFFYNIQNLIRNNNFVTTNQSKLLDKLILKYSRQLIKNGKNIDDLLALIWKCEVKDSLDEYTKAHVSIVDKNITIRSPFNKNFLKEIRNDIIADFTWDKENKMYVAPFTTYSFKFAVDICKKFHTLVLCQQSAQIVEKLKELDNAIWNPTLVNVNGIFYIAAINEFLYDATKDIELNFSPRSISNLSKFGIKSRIQDDPKLEFCNSMIYTGDSNQLDSICEWLLECEIDHVYLDTQLSHKRFIMECKKVIESKGFKILNSDTTKQFNGNYALIKSTSYYEYQRDKIYTQYPSKVIILKNSNPITVR